MLWIDLGSLWVVLLLFRSFTYIIIYKCIWFSYLVFYLTLKTASEETVTSDLRKFSESVDRLTRTQDCIIIWVLLRGEDCLSILWISVGFWSDSIFSKWQYLQSVVMLIGLSQKLSIDCLTSAGLLRGLLGARWTQWKWSHFSHVQLFVTPWTVAHQAPLSMRFSRQEYWSGLPFPPPGELPDPGIKSRSLQLQADSLLSEPAGKSQGLDTHSP